jgi:ribose transport system ATP-binding protein
MHAGLRGFGWRKRALSLIRAKLDEIFPGNHIDCTATVGELSIAERQMVEIAITFAAVTDAPRLVILDEPTSSLDAGLAEQLLAHVRRFVASGGAVLLISHILGEILSTSSRIVVMKDGRVVASRPAAEFTVHTLVEAMGSVSRNAPAACNRPKPLFEASLGGPYGFKARKGESSTCWPCGHAPKCRFRSVRDLWQLVPGRDGSPSSRATARERHICYEHPANLSVALPLSPAW